METILEAHSRLGNLPVEHLEQALMCLHQQKIPKGEVLESLSPKEWMLLGLMLKALFLESQMATHH